jgi:hypothetical protein
VKFGLYNPEKSHKKTLFAYRKVEFGIYNPEKSQKISISI